MLRLGILINPSEKCTFSVSTFKIFSNKFDANRESNIAQYNSGFNLKMNAQNNASKPQFTSLPLCHKAGSGPVLGFETPAQHREREREESLQSISQFWFHWKTSNKASLAIQFSLPELYRMLENRSLVENKSIVFDAFTAFVRVNWCCLEFILILLRYFVTSMENWKHRKPWQGREANKVWMDLIYQDVPTEHKLALTQSAPVK